MAEEHRCQAPEGHRLCVNNCGFFGSSATMNLCSKCYGDVCLKEQQQASIKSTVENSLSSSSPSSSAAATVESLSSASATSPDVAAKSPIPNPASDAPGDAPPQNRCFACRKRVGLTGFRCKCGTTFCGVHRYPEKHACSFDFKKVGREEIAKANPIVKADKLQKI